MWIFSPGPSRGPQTHMPMLFVTTQNTLPFWFETVYFCSSLNSNLPITPNSQRKLPRHSNLPSFLISESNLQINYFDFFSVVPVFQFCLILQMDYGFDNNRSILTGLTIAKYIKLDTVTNPDKVESCCLPTLWYLRLSPLVMDWCSVIFLWSVWTGQHKYYEIGTVKIAAVYWALCLW